MPGIQRALIPRSDKRDAGTNGQETTDPECRFRHCNHLARVFQVLRLIQGPGNWKAQSISRVFDCSERTDCRNL